MIRLGIKADLRNWQFTVSLENKALVDVFGKEITRESIANSEIIRAVEFHLIPQDYERNIKNKIKNIRLKEGLVSFHYPWQFTETEDEFSKRGKELSETISAVNELYDLQKINLAFTLHYQCERFLSYFNEDINILLDKRKKSMEKYQMMLLDVRSKLNDKILLLIENNPNYGDKNKNEKTFPTMDISFNDMAKHLEIGNIGTIFDYVHWKLNSNSMKNIEEYPQFKLLNLEEINSYSKLEGWKKWLSVLGYNLKEVHLSDCLGDDKKYEGISLNPNGEQLNFVKNLPEDVVVIVERRDSYKDLEGDLINLMYINCPDKFKDALEKLRRYEFE